MEYQSIAEIIPYHCPYGCGNCVECEYFEGITDTLNEILVECTRDEEEE